MTGQINVNKIVARSGNLITYDSADVVNITLAKGEGTASTNLKQGLCKHWINCSSDWGTVNDSFNNASVTDVTTGKGTFNFTNNMTGASYFAIADHHNNNASGAGSRYGQVVDTAASGVTVATGRSNNTFTYEEDGNYTEPGCHTMGDLA